MLISELARRTGLSTDTIRFYEKQGVLDTTHFARRDNTYRDYHENAVARLVLVKQAQAAGFTLSEVAGSIHLWETDQLTDAGKMALFSQKIEEIDQRITDLQAIRTYLVAKIARLEASNCDPKEQDMAQQVLATG